MGDVMSGIGQAVGLESTYQGPSQASQDNVARLQAIASGASPTASSTMFNAMANKSLVNTAMGVNAQGGLNAAQRANILSRALSDQNAQLAQQAGAADIQQRQMAQMNLGSILSSQDQMQNAANQAKAGRLAGLIGAGLTAGATMYGNPKLADQVFGADSGNVGMTNSTFFNKNPYM